MHEAVKNKTNNNNKKKKKKKKKKRVGPKLDKINVFITVSQLVAISSTSGYEITVVEHVGQHLPPTAVPWLPANSNKARRKLS